MLGPKVCAGQSAACFFALQTVRILQVVREKAAGDRFHGLGQACPLLAGTGYNSAPARNQNTLRAQGEQLPDLSPQSRVGRLQRSMSRLIGPRTVSDGERLFRLSCLRHESESIMDDLFGRNRHPRQRRSDMLLLAWACDARTHVSTISGCESTVSSPKILRSLVCPWFGLVGHYLWLSAQVCLLVKRVNFPASKASTASLTQPAAPP